MEEGKTFGNIPFRVQETPSQTVILNRMSCQFQIDSASCCSGSDCRNDKLVLKVKEDSDALLMLAGLIPDYVSQNHIDGKEECGRCFPDGYKNAEEEEEEEATQETEEGEGEQNESEN